MNHQELLRIAFAVMRTERPTAYPHELLAAVHDLVQFWLSDGVGTVIT